MTPMPCHCYIQCPYQVFICAAPKTTFVKGQGLVLSVWTTNATLISRICAYPGSRLCDGAGACTVRASIFISQHLRTQCRCELLLKASLMVAQRFNVCDTTLLWNFHLIDEKKWSKCFDKVWCKEINNVSRIRKLAAMWAWHSGKKRPVQNSWTDMIWC